jgi:hypothetical protein
LLNRADSVLTVDAVNRVMHRFKKRDEACMAGIESLHFGLAEFEPIFLRS